MHICAGLFRLKANNKMGHNKFGSLKNSKYFSKRIIIKLRVKKHLSSEKQRVKCILIFQSLLRQRRSENLVFQKNESKYLHILKMRGGNMQRHFCINQCILLFWGNSKSFEVIETKCDHRKLLMQVKKRQIYKFNKNKALCTFDYQMEI